MALKSLNFGGPGATGTLASMLFNQQAGVNIVVVPFKGSNAAEVSILQGEIQLLFSSIGGAVPFLSSGKMRALAVTSLQRLPQYPNVPTLDESGLKGYEMDFWIGLFAPAATPKELVARINQDVALVSAQADLKEKYNAMGYDVVGESPERFSAFLQRSVDKYTRIIREFGMSAE